MSKRVSFAVVSSRCHAQGWNIASGGGGNDTYVIGSNDGRLVITDFRAGGTQDAIDLSGTNLTSFADVDLHARDRGRSTLITVDADTSILLQGVKASRLTTADFVFGIG